MLAVEPQIKAHHFPVKLMGCAFVLTAADEDPQLAWDAIRAGVSEIERIEELISSWKETSETSQINRQAGNAPVKVSKELFDLIDRSVRVSDLSNGAFDITGTLSRDYWNFNKEENTMLPSEKINELKELVNFRLIDLDREKQTVFLRRSGMKIGFGGIGKGYAAYKAHEVMKNMGIKHGLINASGDLMAWGNPPNRENWSINIPDPVNRDENLLEIKIPYGSVVTSGNYENYTLIDGKKYSHIIDPRTGLPVERIKNVSVTCPNPEFADAMATAISVMGAEAGIKLVDQLNGIECIVIDKDNKIYYSKHLNEQII